MGAGIGGDTMKNRPSALLCCPRRLRRWDSKWPKSLQISENRNLKMENSTLNLYDHWIGDEFAFRSIASGELRCLPNPSVINYQ